MKKCAIFFTLFVLLLIIASITDGNNKPQEVVIGSNSEVNFSEQMVNTTKVKNITEQE